ncbi:MAG: hypothetical protein NW206_19975 [Hyphomonadaceae bacterium]|nr:hypothetical protein [Hyphomonadaceae bacterium]
MTGYMIAMGACIGCRAVFSFNPHLVPSMRVNGVREPICATCVAIANPKRKANGLPLIDILPGAYDEEPI